MVKEEMKKDRQTEWSNVIEICYDNYFTLRNHPPCADSSPVCCRLVDPPLSERINSLGPSTDQQEWAGPGLGCTGLLRIQSSFFVG